ncbi:hypothetical protein GCM10017778_14350 [Streptomyces vinaceus]|nr:hypothetical protein GCM10017778_14350 [Streptomyces vinaceus]
MFAGASPSDTRRAAFWRGVQSAKAGGAGGEKVTAGLRGAQGYGRGTRSAPDMTQRRPGRWWAAGAAQRIRVLRCCRRS